LKDLDIEGKKTMKLILETAGMAQWYSAGLRAG
jgi:hypothetical protein